MTKRLQIARQDRDTLAIRRTQLGGLALFLRYLAANFLEYFHMTLLYRRDQFAELSLQNTGKFTQAFFGIRAQLNHRGSNFAETGQLRLMLVSKSIGRRPPGCAKTPCGVPPRPMVIKG